MCPAARLLVIRTQDDAGAAYRQGYVQYGRCQARPELDVTGRKGKSTKEAWVTHKGEEGCLL